MTRFEKLIEHFREFPGIGPRQARRFVYFLLGRSKTNITELSQLILDVKAEMKVCGNCFRFFPSENRNANICPICSDKNRRVDIMMIVSRDVDLENIEKSQTFNGLYFVLGGTLPILEKEPEKRIRIKELLSRITTDSEKSGTEKLQEIILGMSANPEGENTARYISEQLKPMASQKNIKISGLGRGLSTGTELEYSDPETLKSALENRG